MHRPAEPQKRSLRTLGLIPARGGSKGIPRKNIRLLGGRPLLKFTAEAALAASRLSRVVLSTDDHAIAEVAVACGLDVPFLRPPELAQDDTPMLKVVQHALGYMERKGDTFDAVCILQPTTPFRELQVIDDCIDRLEREEVDCVMTVREVPTEFNPRWVYFTAQDGCLRLSTGDPAPIPTRQALPPAYYRDGSVYVSRRDVVMQRNSLYGRLVAGHLVTSRPAINIDTEEDWRRAEQFLCAASTHAA